MAHFRFTPLGPLLLFFWETQLPHSGLGFSGRGGEQLFDAAAFWGRGEKKKNSGKCENI